MNDQAGKLRRLMQVRNNSRHAKTISVISGKGGVGKSNVAVNFCLQLKKHDKKVLLFDLDFGMGNVDILLGLQPNKTVIDMFNEQLPIHEVIEKGPGGLTYIAGGSGLTRIFKADRAMMNYFFDQFNELIQMYDYIVFDMGAGAAEESIRFVLASDECIVVTTPEPTSMTDGYGMVKHILSHHPSMPLHIVMNRSQTEKSGKAALIRLKQTVSQFLQAEIQLMGVLPEDKNVSKSVMSQTPFLLHNDKSPIAKAIKKLTSEYLAGSQDIKEEKMSFVKKLKQLLIER